MKSCMVPILKNKGDIQICEHNEGIKLMIQSKKI